MSTTTGLKQMGERSKQAGMVSIMVTMVLMIVLSLTVMGFAQIARRNSRQALDRQLSTSAFYAAEAGINDVRDLIKNYGPPPAKTDCSNGSGATAAYYGRLPSSVLDSAANVQYSCVMVDPTATTLPYTLGYTSKVVPLTAASGTINTLRFVWQKSTTSATPTNGCTGALTPAGSWTCGYAALRFDLVPVSGTVSFSGLQNATMSTYAVPDNGGSTTTAYSATGNRSLARVRCTVTNCTLTITGLGGSSYYLRVMSQYYQNVNFQISGADAVGGAVSFTGAQVLIDVTGRAQDVLRRVQVRVPASGNSTNNGSDYALQTTDSICKRFDIMTNHYQSDAGNAVPGMDNGNNPLCKSP